jgi:hypothetical protein
MNSDYYPMADQLGTFVSTMKPFHDKYASPGHIFAIGETGLGFEAPIETRLAWFKEVTSPETRAALPFYISMSWLYVCSSFFSIFASTDPPFD